MWSEEPAEPGAWQTIARAQFVSLGTFRRNGDLVAAPVWLAADGETFVVTSEAHTGKVKRLRRDDRVLLRVCSRFGAIDPDSPTVSARGIVAGDPHQHPSASSALRQKYGFQFTAFLSVERLVRRIRRQPGDRVILRISRIAPRPGPSA